jgi:hypothetical protein
VIREIRPVIGQVETKINISSLQKGLYMISLTSGDQTETLKLIKQ